MPVHVMHGDTEKVSLIDGSVLVNKPFGGAMAALRGRPAQREVDRRFVYVDPRPDRYAHRRDMEAGEVGFFSAIFGSLSTIPREQPIRDNLEQLEEQSREAERLSRIVAALRPDVESAVDRLFGRTLFLDRPTVKRLKNWRQKAQDAAANQAGYAFHAYAQAKLSGIVSRIARLVWDAAPALHLPDAAPIEAAIRRELAQRGLSSLSAPSGGATDEAITFLREHDIGFRIRRLRLLARRLARDWEADPEISDEALEVGRDAIFKIMALYFEKEGAASLGDEFAAVAQDVLASRAPYSISSSSGACDRDRQSCRRNAGGNARAYAGQSQTADAIRLSGVSILRCRNASLVAQRRANRVRSGQGRPDKPRRCEKHSRRGHPGNFTGCGVLQFRRVLQPSLS